LRASSLFALACVGGWRGGGSGDAALLAIGEALIGFAICRGFLLPGLHSARLIVSRLKSGFPSLCVISALLMGHDHRGVAAEIAPQLLGVVVVDRTRMGQGFDDAEIVQFIDDLTRLNFELPRQLIDSDLTHV
jgi:hypothetical protein